MKINWFGSCFKHFTAEQETLHFPRISSTEAESGKLCGFEVLIFCFSVLSGTVIGTQLNGSSILLVLAKRGMDLITWTMELIKQIGVKICQGKENMCE